MAEEKATQHVRQQEASKDTRTLDQRIADLELANAQLRAGIAGGTMPWNGGGRGEEVSETWCQAYQEAEDAADRAEEAERASQ